MQAGAADRLGGLEEALAIFLTRALRIAMENAFRGNGEFGVPGACGIERIHGPEEVGLNLPFLGLNLAERHAERVVVAFANARGWQGHGL